MLLFLANPRYCKLHVALSSTQPDVTKQHISQSDCVIVGRCGHIVGTPGLNRLQTDPPRSCENQKSINEHEFGQTPVDLLGMR